MATQKMNVKVLHERRDRLKADLDGIKARIDEIDTLLRLMNGDAPPDLALTLPTRKSRRGDLKEIVLALYDEAGHTGLSSSECVEAATVKKGVTLQPASVSSLLSRLKSDGVMAYDGDRYRLKRFSGPREAA